MELFTVGCANIIPPSGGPRDSMPPVLISANPKDSTLNFKGNRIVLTFNEYVDIDNAQDNFLFTPLFETVPQVDVKLRTITVRLRDTLEQNTTYTFNFGNAIKDINESNPFRQFTYTFSTGPYLDSLQISGRVILAENGKVDSTLTVVLHRDQRDSAVTNQRPRYATRLDSTGRFTFINLPRDTFAIYAIGEAGIMRRYNSPDQLFAFSDSAAIAGSGSTHTLYAYREEVKEEKKRSSPITSGRSGGGAVPAAAERRLRIGNNLAGGQQDLLTDLLLTVERPLRNFDSTKMLLSTDTTFTPVPAYSIALDSTQKGIKVKTAWKEGTVYHLITDKEFAEDSSGRKLLRPDTLTFVTKKLKDYGQLDIRLNNIDLTKNPVLQFVQNEKVVFGTSVTSGTYRQALFLPGDYDLRILYDRNNNGIWDAGEFFGVRRQPELVVPIARKITVKPDWENEFDIGL
jgi:hypothetical protein